MNNNSFSLDLQKNEGIGSNALTPTQDSGGGSAGSGISITSFCWPTGPCPTNSGCSSPTTQSITKNSIFVKCGQF
ncbi:hypothetical protein [Clostridium sp. UBA5988]|uniref:hypothetical protein n=1 Tax=Clostridium sp. UBA5988 TaxID=1946369 RepID=UPI0011CCA0F9